MDDGVSPGMATNTGSPARAPYAESAAPALPAVGAASEVAPRARAIVTAAAMPRDLNERVGFFDSSLIQRFGRVRDGRRGVMPSPRETIGSVSRAGSTSAYRHIVAGRPRIASRSAGSGARSYWSQIRPPHARQRLTSWRVSYVAPQWAQVRETFIDLALYRKSEE